MKKLFTLIVLLVSLVVSSCMYDDTGIWDRINDHEQRIVALEELCREMNTNISALQALIEASQNGDYITNVSPITKDGQIIGYTISFANGEPITIYNGVDGKDGLNGESAPVIGVRQDTDGIYYWTIDGEWLTDESGNKVKAEGTDGKDGQDGEDGQDGKDGVDGEDGRDGQDGEDGRDGVDGEDGRDGQDGEDGRDGVDGEDGEDGRNGQDGVTPRLKIEDDYWYVSYDNGQTWYLLDRATGDDGDSLFVSVSQDEENVYFILADGTEIVIPKYSGSDEPASENNKIYYTTTDGKKIFPYNGAIDAVLVSNIYEGGQGVMVFDDDITSIRNAFNAEYTLESVVIPASVKEIGYQAFYNCTSLSTVYCKATLPPDAYFYNNNNLTWTPFDGNAALRRIYVPEASVNSYRNDSDWSRYASAIKAEGNDSESVVTEIYYTTTNGKPLSLDYSKFDVSVSGNVYDSYRDMFVLSFDGELSSIPASAFTGKSTLETIIIPEGVTTIETDAFYNCSNLYNITIPDSVTTIGDGAFEYCESLTEISIPDSVTTIGEDAFWGCNDLTYVYITDLAAWCNIDFGSRVFRYNGYIILNYEFINELVIPDEVTEIKPYAFGNCIIDSVTIPDSVTAIGNSAFNGCEYLMSINFGNGVKSIGNYAFYGCESLTEITIPDSVTTIGEDAFCKCENLESVVIGNGVKSIGKDAFDSCLNVERVYITDLTAWCNIDFADDANPIYYGSLYLNGELLTDVVVPEGITELKPYVFESCYSIMSVTIPDSVTTIGARAFRDCRNLTSVDVGNGIKSIGNDAFGYCESLTEITIPDSVTTIGESAFSGCKNLTSVYITDLAAWCNIDFDTINANPLYGISYYDKAYLYLDGELVTEVTIPSSIVEIKPYTFTNCGSLTSVKLHSAVTSIGSNAFGDCENLSTINIPASITSIGKYAFQYCSSLSSVYIANITAWCNIDFEGASANPLCYSACMYIDDKAVTEVSIPSTITEIKPYTFYGCNSLTSVTIGNSVTTIETKAFFGCSNLTSVTLREGITSVGAHAFYETGITEVTVPASVAYIDIYAFASGHLKTAKLLSKTPCQLGSKTVGGGIFVPQTFNGQFGSASIYVPAESLYEYKADWANWADRIFPFE